MKVLIVYTHPNPASFCHAIMETAEAALKLAGNEVMLRNLYSMDFDPVLKSSDFAAVQAGKPLADVKTEQDYITWAEAVVFIYPIWWSGMPAMLKGFIDRTHVLGFAYKYENGFPKGLLTGKKVVLISTHGAPKELYDSIGMTRSIQQTSDAGIFKFSGYEVVAHEFFGNVVNTDNATRKGYLEKVKEVITKLK